MLWFVGLQRLRPMIRYGPYGRPGCSTTVAVTGIGDSPCVCDSPCGCDCRLRSCWDGGRPLYEYRNVKPPQPQVKKRGKNCEKDRLCWVISKLFTFSALIHRSIAFCKQGLWLCRGTKTAFRTGLCRFREAGLGWVVVVVVVVLVLWETMEGQVCFFPVFHPQPPLLQTPPPLMTLERNKVSCYRFSFFGHFWYIWCGYLRFPL